MHTDLNQATSDFCPVLTELLQPRKAVGRTGRIYKELAALSTHNNLYVVYELMRETRASLAKVLQFLRASVPRTGLNELDLSCYREKGQIHLPRGSLSWKSPTDRVSPRRKSMARLGCTFSLILN